MPEHGRSRELRHAVRRPVRMPWLLIAPADELALLLPDAGCFFAVRSRASCSRPFAPPTSCSPSSRPCLSPRVAVEPQPVTVVPRAPASPRRSGAGISALSVPKILLGLGALCLLVAAVIFLAVAWSWLGVGGRTAVLAGLTLVSGGLGVWLSRRELRVAGEALTTVSLGLLALDVIGADNAGWLGDLTVEGLVIAVGSALLAAALALDAGHPADRGPARRCARADDPRRRSARRHRPRHARAHGRRPRLRRARRRSRGTAAPHAAVRCGGRRRPGGGSDCCCGASAGRRAPHPARPVGRGPRALAAGRLAAAAPAAARSCAATPVRPGRSPPRPPRC